MKVSKRLKGVGSLLNSSETELNLSEVDFGKTLPRIAVACAGALALLFVILSHGMAWHASEQQSERKSEQLAQMIAADLTLGNTDSVQTALTAYDADGTTIFNLQGKYVLGERKILLPDTRRLYPIVHDGVRVGVLATPKLQPFKPPLPYWLTALMTALAFALAYFVTRYYAMRLSQATKTLTAYAREVADSNFEASVETVAFTELGELRDALVSAAKTMRGRVHALEAQLYNDAATGLPNVTRLHHDLKSAAAEANFENPAAYVLFRFETQGGQTSATYSVAQRDLLLAAANRIRADLESRFSAFEDLKHEFTLARVSNEHLGLFIRHAGSRSEVSALLRDLRRRIAAPFDINGRAIALRLSGGVALMPEDGATPETVFSRAELALKKMQDEAQHGFKFYTPRLDRIEEGRLRLEAELREGIQNNEFRAAFQPKIDFRTGKITGFEALARWRRASGRIVSPAAFIPLAEETGLIRDIGDRILIQSCQKAKEWLAAGVEASVAVNVSPLQFDQRRFVDKIIETLRLTGLPPSLLELEITETMAVSDTARVSTVMAPLRAMGISLAIDDFGTGHSNLSMLSQLPFSTFKIDRQFVSALERGGQSAAIVEMILAMAETLGLETVAEGVETESQADFLRRRGCTLAQGYLYSPAVPSEDVIDFAVRWNNGQPEEFKRKVGQV